MVGHFAMANKSSPNSVFSNRKDQPSVMALQSGAAMTGGGESDDCTMFPTSPALFNERSWTQLLRRQQWKSYQLAFSCEPPPQ